MSANPGKYDAAEVSQTVVEPAAPEDVAPMEKEQPNGYVLILSRSFDLYSSYFMVLDAKINLVLQYLLMFYCNPWASTAVRRRVTLYHFAESQFLIWGMLNYSHAVKLEF